MITYGHNAGMLSEIHISLVADRIIIHPHKIAPSGKTCNHTEKKTQARHT